MFSLQLSQQDADKLIALYKEFMEKYSKTLEEGSRGTILIRSQKSNREFRLDYYYAKGNSHINFNDRKTNLNLVRMNLNESFHKNGDGNIVRGNRVNLFSEEEYLNRNDGQYMKAHKLPYKDIFSNPQDFIDALEQMLNYTNVKDYDDKLCLVYSDKLNL